jgi:small subunit ribosomal protein S27e
MSKFLSVQCAACKAKQTVFGNATETIACAGCGDVICTPTGGRTIVTGKIVEVL